MSDLKERASAILREFKGDRYDFGSGVLDGAPGKFAAEFGKKALVIGSTESDWFQPIMGRILKSLESAGLEVVGTVKSAAPNAPFVDVYRIHSHIVHKNPDVIVAAAGGSGIDAAKAAATLATLGGHQPEIDSLSGTDLGLAVAGGMVNFSKFLEFPIRLSDVPGISEDHIDKCVTAAKNPQLDMKLRNIPVPLNADLVDEYMRPILEAAWSGEFEKIKPM